MTSTRPYTPVFDAIYIDDCGQLRVVRTGEPVTPAEIHSAIQALRGR